MSSVGPSGTGPDPTRRAAPTPLAWPAPRPCPGRCRAFRHRSGRALRPAPRARSLRRVEPGRFPAARRFARAPAGLPRTSRLDGGAEVAIREFDPYSVPRGDGRYGADDLGVLPHDRIAAGEGCARRECAQAASPLVEGRAATFGGEKGRPPGAP